MHLTRRSLLASAAGAAAAPAAPSRPNVVLMLADDLGWNDAGYQDSEISTPNIDRIAGHGVRFTHLYTYPFCTPTRCGLMTGRSPVRYGLIYSVIRPWSAYGLPRDERTMAESFRSLGYQTAMVGKWHLGHAHRRMLPNARGFDHFYGFVNADIDCYRHTHMGGLDWQRNGIGVREEGYSTDLMAAEAERLIRGRDPGRPLFLYFAFNAVHTPIQAPEELVRKYQHLENPKRRVYAAMAESMDLAVGRVLRAVEQAGIAQNTLVMFLSDNGGATGPGGSNKPLRGAKGTVYEGGIRVPAAALWPGRLEGGRRVAQVSTVLDLLPTLTAAAGGKPAAAKPLDGVNLWPQWSGAAPPVERRDLFFAVKRNESPDYHAALRDGPWKLVRQLHGEALSAPDQLFHLDDDPLEQTDLAAREPERVRSLAEGIQRWQALHPKAEINSSMTPHPGWIPPRDYAAAAADYE